MLRSLLRKAKTVDGKILVQNFLSLSSIQVANLILPLITLPYIIRVVGLEKYGTIILASSLINYFYTLCDYSFKITATRDVVLFRNSLAKLNLVFSKVTYIKSMLLFVSILAIAIIVISYPDFRSHYLIFLLSAVGLVGNTYFPDWFFQGIEKMIYISVSNVFIKLVFTVLVFIFIQDEVDYWMYPLFFSSGYLLSSLFAFGVLYFKYKIRLVSVSPRELVRTLKTSFPVFTNQFFPNLYNTATTFFLGVFVGHYWVGMYDAVKKVVDVLSVGIGILSRVFFPFLNRRKSAFLYYFKICIVTSLGLALIPIVFYEQIFLLLNIVYEDSFVLIAILSTSIVFLALYDIFGLNYFIARRQDKLVMKNTIVSSLIGIILVYPMLTTFGIIGAALNLAVCRLLMGGGLLYKYLTRK